MEETKQIDWSCSADILKAAQAWDKTYVPGKTVVALAGTELIGFIKHHFAPRAGAGRRISDQRLAERLKQLEAENARLTSDVTLLQSENNIFRHRLMKDRRQRNDLVQHERRGQSSATVVP